MRIPISKSPSSTGEMIEILKSKFSDSYSFKMFGLGAERKIIARKSMFVGAEISQVNNEVQIEGVFPSVPFLLIRTLLFYTGAGGDIGIIKHIFPSKWRNVEKEIGSFIKKKFNS